MPCWKGQVEEPRRRMVDLAALHLDKAWEVKTDTDLGFQKLRYFQSFGDRYESLGPFKDSNRLFICYAGELEQI